MPSSNSSNKPSPFSIPQGTRLSGGIDPRQFSRDYKEEKASQSLQNLQSVPLSDDHRRILVKEHVGFKSDSMSYNPFAAFARTHPSESIRSQATFHQAQQGHIDRARQSLATLQLEGRLHKERLQREARLRIAAIQDPHAHIVGQDGHKVHLVTPLEKFDPLTPNVHAVSLAKARGLETQRADFFRSAVPSPRIQSPQIGLKRLPPPLPPSASDLRQLATTYVGVMGEVNRGIKNNLSILN